MSIYASTDLDVVAEQELEAAKMNWMREMGYDREADTFARQFSERANRLSSERWNEGEE